MSILRIAIAALLVFGFDLRLPAQDFISAYATQRLGVTDFHELDKLDRDFFSKANDADLKTILARSDNLLAMESKWEQIHRKILAQRKPLKFEQGQIVLSEFLDFVEQRIGVEVPTFWQWHWSRKVFKENGYFESSDEPLKGNRISSYELDSMRSTNADKMIVRSQSRNDYAVDVQLASFGGILDANTKQGQRVWSLKLIGTFSPEVSVQVEPTTVSVFIIEKDPFVYIFEMDNADSARLFELTAETGKLTGYFTLGSRW